MERWAASRADRRKAFEERLTTANDIDTVVADQAEAYMQASLYHVGQVPFERELLRKALNVRRRRKSCGPQGMSDRAMAS